MAYASVQDVQARMVRDLSEDEQAVCSALLEDAAVIIDACAPGASADAKRVVSCRMVVRALGDGVSQGYPVGATQGSMSGLGYAQSWTMGTGSSAGELYLSRLEKQLLGVGGSIGARSPVEAMCPGEGNVCGV